MSADGNGNSNGDGDSGPGRREVAHRLFAAEFDDATVSYAESDEERAPKYVVTPTGARVNRLFAVGVLTEVESVNDDVLRARVVDPTGAFVSYAGQYQPDAAAFFERAETPAFVALTGKARTFEPDDGDRIYTSVRPESVAEVDAGTRDRWTVSAAEASLRRVAAMADARLIDATGDDLRAALLDRGYDESLAAGIPIALERYGTTTAYLDAVRQVALDALEVVAGDRDAVRALDTAPDDEGTTSLGALPDAVTADRATAATETASATDGERSDATATSTSDEEAESATSESEASAATTTDEATATESTTVEETTTDATSAKESEADETATGEQPAERSEDEADTETADGDSSLDETVKMDESADTEGTDTATSDDDLGDFDEDDLYELDEEERREVEESFDVGFESGAEVGGPGEADIDVPGPEDLEESVDAGDETDAATETDTESEDEDEDDSSADTDASAEDVNLETAAIDVMDELDDGDGADREAVIAAVVDEYGADPGAVADAIEDALMNGRCYEPSEDHLKAI